MSELTNPHVIAKILQRHQLTAQKKYGQNFLVDDSVLEASLSTADIQPQDTIIEIGAGIGVLTIELAKRAQKVIVFEVDQSLRPILLETLAGFTNIELHFQDFRHVNLDQIFGQRSTINDQPISYKIVANLPYNAGTHIIGQLIQSSHPPQSMTVLLQKEVAQKITAQPPHATYLSNFIQTYGQPEIIQIINPGSFTPSPKVDSALLHITSHQSSVISHPKIAFSRFLHRGFSSPRKKINKAFAIEELETADIDPNLRPENLRFEDWQNLFKITTKHVK